MNRMLTSLAFLIVLAVAGFAAYVRLAPSNPQVWHQRAPADWTDRAVKMLASGPSADLVVSRTGGAYAPVTVAGKTGAEVLAALDAIAMATPRTTRLAGSPEEGMITWVTRSALWGFPDYTTAEIVPGSGPAAIVMVNARLRFGQSDTGVNAARLRDWLAKLNG